MSVIRVFFPVLFVYFVFFSIVIVIHEIVSLLFSSQVSVFFFLLKVILNVNYNFFVFLPRCSDATLVSIPVEVETPDHHYYHV